MFDSVQKDSPAGAGASSPTSISSFSSPTPTSSPAGAGGEKRGFGERSGAVGVAGSKLLPKRKPLAATENLKPGHLKGVGGSLSRGFIQLQYYTGWFFLTFPPPEFG